MSSIKLKILLVILILYVNTGNLTKIKKPRYKPKIVGGRETNINKHPYLVSLRYVSKTEYTHICGGTIITTKFVLTAAHCICEYCLCYNTNGKSVCNEPHKYMAVAGSTYLYNMQKSEKYQISRIKHIFLKNYTSSFKKSNKAYMNDDIALLLLVSPFEKSKNVQIIKIPTTDFFKYKEPWEMFAEPCLTVGWGFLKYESGNSVDTVREVELPIITNKKCAQMEKDLLLLDSQVCTSDLIGKKDVCSGDSGGPLICHGLQIGIVSFAEGCAMPDRANIWTRVDKYADWIQLIIRHTSDKVLRSTFSLSSVNQVKYINLIILQLYLLIFFFI